MMNSRCFGDDELAGFARVMNNSRRDEQLALSPGGDDELAQKLPLRLWVRLWITKVIRDEQLTVKISFNFKRLQTYPQKAVMNNSRKCDEQLAPKFVKFSVLPFEIINLQQSQRPPPIVLPVVLYIYLVVNRAKPWISHENFFSATKTRLPFVRCAHYAPLLRSGLRIGPHAFGTGKGSPQDSRPPRRLTPTPATPSHDPRNNKKAALGRMTKKRVYQL